MFIVANGAFKSGSTWLKHIIDELVDYEELPRQYQHHRSSRMIEPARLKAFLNNVDTSRANYVVKAHFRKPHHRDLLLARPNVRVLDIKRDIKDSLVSHYHHLQRIGKTPDTFHSYYWNIGRFKAVQIKNIMTCGTWSRRRFTARASKI